ncbi:MAG: hypothetical protein ACRDJC_19470 [Thermomicrobiales bacterium]
MDDRSFDRLTRRLVLGGFMAALGLGTARLPDGTNARKRKKKLKRNEFGCVNVGRFCKNGGQCCSGICRGKKGKKKCRGHDAGVGCQSGDQGSFCAAGTDKNCITKFNNFGTCATTTGNAGYCYGGFDCFACSKDAECLALCGGATACIRCAVGCENEGGTACATPSLGPCNE